MALDPLTKQFNFIWLNGSSDEQEEVQQLLVEFSKELERDRPDEETQHDCLKLLTTLLPNLDEDQRRTLGAHFEDLAQRIAAARHRDITLI